MKTPNFLLSLYLIPTRKNLEKKNNKKKLENCTKIKNLTDLINSEIVKIQKQIGSRFSKECLRIYDVIESSSPISKLHMARL